MTKRFNSENYEYASMRGKKFEFPSFGKFPFLLRWKNVLSVFSYVALPFYSVKVWYSSGDVC